jgi:DUF1680 family protein
VTHATDDPDDVGSAGAKEPPVDHPTPRDTPPTTRRRPERRSQHRPDRRTVLRTGVGVAATGAGLALAGGPAGAAVRTKRRAAAAPTASVASRAALAARAVPSTWRLRPFSMAQVQVRNPEMVVNRDRMLRLAREYPVDRVLANFRRTAGLDTRGAEPPGGWDDATGNLRGHYSGHLLSMTALAFAGTGEAGLRTKIDALVAGLAECQAAMAAAGVASHPGFLAAYPEEQFVRLEQYATYPSIWAPYYTCHKILAGLLDCHVLGGNAQALEVATGIARWVHQRLSACTEQQRQRMWALYIAGEYGGMNESLVEIARLTGDDTFLQTARYFDNTRLLDACAADTDILDGLHANQHIPQFLGYVGLHDAGDTAGSNRYLRAVENFWTMVVPHRMYSHGGTGQGEIFRGRDAIAASINGTTNAETCACYNMLKLSRLLFLHDQDPAYMDYYERGLLNQVVGSKADRDTTTLDPLVTYMLPVGPGAVRGFGNIGTCCGGTGLENHLKYQDTIYLHSADDTELWVNLYLDSVLDWTEKGWRVEQQTTFPAEGRSRLVVSGTGPMSLRLRVPHWVERGFRVTVNGSPVPVEATPGSYVAVDRTWASGDVVEIDMPLSLRTEQAIDDPTLQTAFHGPIALAPRQASSTYRAASFYPDMRLSGELGGLTPTAEANTFTDGRSTWAPLSTANGDPYHLYVRRSEPRIAFGGQDAGVANVRDVEDVSFLDRVWSAAPFADRRALLRRVDEVSAAFVAQGAMSRRDRQGVVLAAAKAPVKP